MCFNRRLCISGLFLHFLFVCGFFNENIKLKDLFENKKLVMVGSNTFWPWARHLASVLLSSLAVAFPWGSLLVLCGMENCGLGFVCFQNPNLQGS